MVLRLRYENGNRYLVEGRNDTRRKFESPKRVWIGKIGSENIRVESGPSSNDRSTWQNERNVRLRKTFRGIGGTRSNFGQACPINRRDEHCSDYTAFVTRSSCYRVNRDCTTTKTRFRRLQLDITIFLSVPLRRYVYVYWFRLRRFSPTSPRRPQHPIVVNETACRSMVRVRERERETKRKPSVSPGPG